MIHLSCIRVDWSINYTRRIDRDEHLLFPDWLLSKINVRRLRRFFSYSIYRFKYCMHGTLIDKTRLFKTPYLLNNAVNCMCNHFLKTDRCVLSLCFHSNNCPRAT